MNSHRGSWETFYARTLSHLSLKEKSHDHHEHNHGHDLGPAEDEQEDEEDEHDEEQNVDDDSDPGTSWFSEHNAPEKVLRFLTSRDFPLSPRNTRRTTKTNTSTVTSTGTTTGTGTNHPTILDLGTGNGSMLALLRRKGGFRGDMVGVDYSARSVELARELQRSKLHSAYREDDDDDDDDEDEDDEGKENAIHATPDDTDTNIRFEEWDILGSSSNKDALSLDELRDGKHRRLDWFPYEQGGFDIVLDKGTFDAVSLSDEVVEKEEEKKRVRVRVRVRVCELYPAIAKRLVRRGGFLVVTSCNWTEEELIRWFTKGGDGGGDDDEDRLTVWDRVEYPRFRFGGQEGQGVCTVCFRKGNRSHT